MQRKWKSNYSGTPNVKNKRRKEWILDEVTPLLRKTLLEANNEKTLIALNMPRSSTKTDSLTCLRTGTVAEMAEARV